jgi:DNA-binding transcriptional regulator LsrR (DeoR family)
VTTVGRYLTLNRERSLSAWITLRHILDLILIAGGAHEARAVRAAIRAGLGTTLVTDQTLANEVLRLPT